MKRTFLLAAMVTGALGASAQSGGASGITAFKGPKGSTSVGTPSFQHPTPSFEALRAAAFWSEDFSGGSVPTGWTNTDDLTPSGTPEVTFQWSNDPAVVGPSALGYVPSSVFGSTDANNGFLWANSDRGLSAAPGTDHLTRLTTTVIDCSSQPTVLLTMQSLVGVFDYDATTNVRVNVSTDNVNWTSFVPFPCLETGAAAPPCVRWSANPQAVAVDISSAAANQSTVYVRFEWLGGWEYFWAIDDIALSPIPDFELAMNYGVLSHTGFGEEYGRTPSAQLNPTFNLGSQVRNFGINTQNNVTLSAEVRNASNVLVVSASDNAGSLANGDTATMNEFVTLPALAEGIYTGTFAVSSDEIGNDSETANDTILRTFAIDDLSYSLDGIGVHLGDPVTATIGTASFTTSDDGSYFMTFYPVRATMSVFAIDVLLDATTAEGGQIIASIHDSSAVLGGDVDSPFIESLDYTVTAADVTNGIARVPLYGGVELTPGAYYAAVQLFSNADANRIMMVDDNTVPQPSLASLIYLPDEADPGPYTNGNAIGIRMILDPAASIIENELAGVSVFPNPTDGLVQVVVDQPQAVDVTVMNVLGEVLNTGRFVGRTTIDLTGYAPGIYSIRVSDGKASTTHLVAR
jgi:hypothetical protein